MFRLEDLGWSSAFGAPKIESEGEDLTAARVFKENREIYTVRAGAGELRAEISGKLRHEARGRVDLPAVGDWVAVRAFWQQRTGVIRRILPRRTTLVRKAAGPETEAQIVAANVDTVFLMTGLDGDFNLRRIERHLALAWESGARPVVLLNKCDLAADPQNAAAQVARLALGAPVHAISALDGQGFDALEPYLDRGRTVALIGSSGVGKSTLVNRLVGVETQRVAPTRDSDDRGRHTTTARRLVVLPSGAILVDTPGMRELALWGDSGIEQAFGDLADLARACRFRDCAHEGEPGCAVRDALDGGELDPARLESYRKLEREQRHLALRKDARARSEANKKVRKLHKAFRDPRFPY